MSERRVIHGEPCEQVTFSDLKAGDVVWVLGCGCCGSDHRGILISFIVDVPGFGRDGWEILPRACGEPDEISVLLDTPLTSRLTWRVINDDRQAKADEATDKYIKAVRRLRRKGEKLTSGS